jgi:serine/threonine protein kinase
LKFGAYDLLEVIGRGAMGIVYRGRSDAGEPVAVKIIDSRAASSAVLLRRFEQECAAARRLDHPNVIRALDYGVFRGEPYLVMEYVEGRTLGAKVFEGGPLPPAAAVRIIRQLSEGLDAAHRHGLIHRDVKPDNVLLTSEGQAKLGDLGLVKDLKGSPDLTQSGTWLGTVDYMAPEQFGDAKNVDARCDVYGLAATFYFLNTGTTPFPARGELAILKKKMKNDLVPAGSLAPSLAPAFDQAIREALDATPERRPESCPAFAAKLEAALAAPASDAPVAEARTGKRFPTRAEAKCRRMTGVSGEWVAKIRDVSPSGICLELDRRYEPGTLLSIQMDFLDAGASLPASVRWVRQVGPRRWAVGCALSRRLTDAELIALLEHKSPTIALDPALVAPPGSAGP